jgi:biopolymer transport protein ExbD
MRVRSEPESHEESFDLTAMIDVMLFVFLFFLVATQFTQLDRTPLDLPRQSGDAGAEEVPGSAIISMDRDGSLSFEGEPMEAEGIVRQLSMQDAALKSARGPTATLVVIVRADRACPAGHLNRLATRLVGANIRQWKLATAGEE